MIRINWIKARGLFRQKKEVYVKAHDGEMIQIPPYKWRESELRISTPSSYSMHSWFYTTKSLRRKLGVSKFKYYIKKTQT